METQTDEEMEKHIEAHKEQTSMVDNQSTARGNLFRVVRKLPSR